MSRLCAVCLTCALCLSLSLGSGVAWAVSQLYINFNATPIKFADSAQTPSATLTMTGATLTAGVGRISTRYDRGAGALPALYFYICTMSLTGTNVVDTTVEWWMAWSNGTISDGQVSATDSALTTSKRNNLKLVGVTIVDQTTSNTDMTASGLVFIPTRYFHWGVWNGTALPFQTSTTAHNCLLYPTWWEQQ
jgi:hypothetical protein